MADAEEGFVVDAEKGGESRRLVERDTALVARDTVGVVEGVAAEMKEDKRLAVDGEMSFFALQFALVEVPVGGVAAGVRYQLYAVEVRGHKVEPFLVHEQSIGGIVVALGDHFGIEPAQDGLRVLIVLHRIKTRIVNSGAQQVAVAGQLAVGGKELRGMRCHQERSGLQLLLYQLQRMKDHDVRIEIDKMIRVVLLQKMGGKKRLHRAAQLKYVIAFRHRHKFFQPYRMRFHDGVRGKALRIETAVDPVHQSYEAGITGIVPQHRIAHVFGRAQVAGRAGGEHDRIHKHSVVFFHPAGPPHAIFV